MEIEEWLDSIKSDELAEMLDELWAVYEKVEKVAKNDGHAWLAAQLLHATYWKDIKASVTHLPVAGSRNSWAVVASNTGFAITAPIVIRFVTAGLQEVFQSSEGLVAQGRLSATVGR